MNEVFVKGTEKLAFYGIKSGDTVTFHRMKGFETLGVSKNPIEYNRKYIDEEFERSDVVGYSPSMDFGFDQIKDDAVHEDIADIIDNEKTGSAAVRPILVVDLTTEATPAGSFVARQRDFSVIADSEERAELYKYSGNLKVAGESVLGKATSTDGWQTCTFTADSE